MSSGAGGVLAFIFIVIYVAPTCKTLRETNMLPFGSGLCEFASGWFSQVVQVSESQGGLGVELFLFLPVVVGGYQETLWRPPLLRFK